MSDGEWARVPLSGLDLQPVLARRAPTAEEAEHMTCLSCGGPADPWGNYALFCIPCGERHAREERGVARIIGR